MLLTVKHSVVQVYSTSGAPSAARTLTMGRTLALRLGLWLEVNGRTVVLQANIFADAGQSDQRDRYQMQ